MNLNIKAISVLNPGQTPVDVSDCPVYAFTKEVQFRFPEHFSNYFAMFEGLHIEQCLLVTYGQFIEGSGLREILETFSLAAIVVGAVVYVKQINRARYCEQVTLRFLYRKLVDIVKADGSALDPLKWLEEKLLSSSMAHHWSFVINLQIEILVFVYSVIEGNFPLYVKSLRNLLKWSFVLDDTNYAWT